MERFGDKVQCNPTVKLKKGKQYPLVDIDKIIPGYKFVSNVEVCDYNGQGGAKYQNRDVLMARITPCLENGKIALADIQGNEGIGSTELLVFRGIDGVSDTDYIYYLLNTKYMRQLAANSMTGASGRQRADLKFIKKIPWKFPALKQQKEISAVLSQYDNLIVINKKRIKLLETTAQQLYKEWFVRFRFPGYEKAKFVDGIPQGWEKCKLKDMIAFNPVYRIKKGSVYTKIPMEALPTDGLSIDTDSIMAEDSSSGTHFMNGDVLCAKITPCLENGKTGLVACLQEDEVGVGSTEFIVMHGERVDSFFVYCIARDERFRQQAINSMNGADGRQRADISFIQNRQWILPDKQIIRQFKALTDKIVATVLRLEQQNKNLAKQRDLLLPRLMSGKLAV